ncbi:MAG: hypothetical protein K2J82_06875 [Muribaculaceae bacterium]|nr:hypothetical protein [Muribaculaceae bacterium]MDE6754317.1 hypothetical protein [Muribaculaceae bacterium]
MDLSIIGIIVGIFIIIIVVALQLSSSNSTRKEIEQLRNLFPSVDKIFLIPTTISRKILSDREELLEFIKEPPFQKDSANLNQDETNLYLLGCKGGNPLFKEIIKETNEYLCKNVGTSADLSILQDICDKKISVKENSIRTSLNMPLYFGLGGTFAGIIVGVFIFMFDLGSVFGVESLGGNGDISGLRALLFGVFFAMIASLCGLWFTIRNTNRNKEAVERLDTQENEYFDFLRRELMPTLSSSMSASLNSLKSVLGHFVDKFGRNLNNYADSAHLLNENLDKQREVLDRIQELGVTKMAKTIATSFSELKESADSLRIFQTYQRGLNSTIQQVTFAIGQMETLINKFDRFLSVLQSVAQNQVDNNSLQKEFKDAIELHFPTGSEGREIWRNEFDNLLKDAREVSKQLNRQLTQNTRYVEKFVTDNERFFSSFDEIKAVIASIAEYARIQGESYSALKLEIENLRRDTLESRKENAQLQKSLLEAMLVMTRELKGKK